MDQNLLYAIPSVEGTNNAATEMVGVAIVELGVDESNNICDPHAVAVLDIFQRHVGPCNRVSLSGLNFGDPQGDGAGIIDFSLDIHKMVQLDHYVDAVSCNVLNAVSNRIQRILQSHPDIKVLNLSFGKSRAEIYQDVHWLLEQSQKLQKAFCKQFKVASQAQDPMGFKKAVTIYVNERLDYKQELHAQALHRYQLVTGHAAMAGLMLIVAADNDHQIALNYGVPGSDFNFLAQSRHVISVAAVDRVGQVWEGSSRGDGIYHPTVSAFGVDIETSVGRWTGTSFATPRVSSAVARMLVSQPTLHFYDVRSILEDTALPLSGSKVAVGAGLLNPEGAMAHVSGTSRMHIKMLRSA